MTPRVLVAGVGNIFLGDDGFGVEAVRELLRGPIPAGVTVRDFGIRSYDLGYAIADGYDTVVFLDATERGAKPGTLSLIELDPPGAPQADEEAINGHSLHPAAVLRRAAALGADFGRLYLVGCEPEILESDAIGVSDVVRAALPGAAAMVRSLLVQLLSPEPVKLCEPPSAAPNQGVSNECLGNRRNRDRDPAGGLPREDAARAEALSAYAPDVTP